MRPPPPLSALYPHLPPPRVAKGRRRRPPPFCARRQRKGQSMPGEEPGAVTLLTPR